MTIVDYSVVLELVFTTGKARRDVMRSPLALLEWEWVPPVVVGWSEVESPNPASGGESNGQAVAEGLRE